MTLRATVAGKPPSEQSTVTREDYEATRAKAADAAPAPENRAKAPARRK